MKKTIISLFLVLLSISSFAQKSNDDKWLVIINGYVTNEEAIEAQNKLSYNSTILNSADYENLNPGWFILTIMFDEKNDAYAKSKELNATGAKTYVKYSGYKRTKDNTIQGNVKFIINGRFVVLGYGTKNLDYDGRSHELVNYGTPIDLCSSIETDELGPGILPWTQEPITLVGQKGEILKDVQIKKLYALTRIQIETYRPPWCFEADDYGDCMSNGVSEDFLKNYIWNGSEYIIVGEIDVNNYAMFAIRNKDYRPDVYKKSSSKILQNNKKFKELSVDAEGIEVYTCNGDTVCTFLYPYEDEICGGTFTNYNKLSWKVGSNQENWIPYFDDYLELKINTIIKFSIQNKSFFFIQNKNTCILIDVDNKDQIELPYNIEDPWEC